MFIVPHNNPTRVGPWAWHATISYTNINTHFIISLYSLLRPASVHFIKYSNCKRVSTQACTPTKENHNERFLYDKNLRRH